MRRTEDWEQDEMLIADTLERGLFSVAIIGRRWFNRREGNTYNTAIVMFNGVPVAEVGFGYGYGSQYEQRGCERAADLLRRFDPITPRGARGETDVDWEGSKLRRQLGESCVSYFSTVANVANRRDL